MAWKKWSVVVLGLLLVGCAKAETPKNAVVKVNDYVVLSEEFEDGFSQSAYALRQDKVEARKDYLNNLINQKLIVQDAVHRNLDKQKDFLRSVERFWEQSLMTVALGVKTREIHGTSRVHDDNVRRLYDQMIADGVTTKTYEDMYPQIRWQAERQLESQLLNDWMDALRQKAQVEINLKYFENKK